MAREVVSDSHSRDFFALPGERVALPFLAADVEVLFERGLGPGFSLLKDASAASGISQ